MDNALFALGMYEEALALFEESSVGARTLGDVRALRDSEIGAARVLTRFDKREQVIARLLPVREGFEPSTDREWMALADMEVLIGMAYHGLDNLEEAERYSRAALLLERSHPEIFPHSQSAAGIYGLVLSDMGREEEALRVVREELVRVRAKGSLTDQSLALGMVAGTELGADDFSAAEVHFREAVEISRRIYGDDHRVVLTDIGNIAVALREQGRHAEAAKLVEQVMSVRRTRYPSDKEDLARSLYSLCILKRGANAPTGALPICQEAFDRLVEVFGRDHPRALKAQQQVARASITLGRFDEARTLLDDVLERRGLSPRFPTRQATTCPATRLLWSCGYCSICAPGSRRGAATLPRGC